MDVLQNQLKQLTSRDLELVARLSERIHYTNSGEPFLNHMYVILNEALPSTYLSVESYSVIPIAFEQAVNVGISDELASIYRTYFYQHPVFKAFVSTAGKTCVTTLLTETSREKFHKTKLYQKFYRVLGVEDQLIFHLLHRNGIYVISYSRDTVFSEKEKTIVQLLRPQLLIALRNWQRIRELEQHLRTLTENSVDREQATRRVFEEKRLLDRLTPRQRAVAEQVAQGRQNREIAEVLQISPKTVGKHLENIFETLDIHNRSMLAAMWQKFKSIG